MAGRMLMMVPPIEFGRTFLRERTLDRNIVVLGGLLPDANAASTDKQRPS
jgi:hypothetical protein